MKKNIIILHGWGLYGSRYQELKKLLEQKNYSVFAPDMPGFGEEPLVKKSMTIDDYVNFVVQFMKKNNIKKAYFIGHSLGGRILAKLAAVHPNLIEKIIITGSPLIRQNLSLKKRCIQFAVKQTKGIIALLPDGVSEFLRKGVYRLIGEWDYYKAKEKKETFKNIIAENASDYISSIKLPVLVLWGQDDKIVPLSVGRQIVERISGAKLEVITNAGHGIPYTHSKKFASHVISFFK